MIQETADKASLRKFEKMSNEDKKRVEDVLKIIVEKGNQNPKDKKIEMEKLIRENADEDALKLYEKLSNADKLKARKVLEKILEKKENGNDYFLSAIIAALALQLAQFLLLELLLLLVLLQQEH